MINKLLKIAFSTLLKKIAYIEKTPAGYYVRSETGRNLGGPYRSYAEALRRLKQVEYFKRTKR